MNKEERKKCPKCGAIISLYPAISRKDNKTEICSDCGVVEAMEEFINHKNKHMIKNRWDKMKSKYNEIFKLKDMLDKEHINYSFIDRSINKSIYTMESYQIIIYKKDGNRLISVIEGYGTYGEENDLLEIMGCLTKEEMKNDSALGYLTASEVLDRIKKNIQNI